MKKLKILFLITDLGKGGAERFLIELCSKLLNYEHIEFKIGVLYDNNQFYEETKQFEIIQLNFKTFSIFGKNKNDNYLKLLKEFKPDIIHTHRFLAEFLSCYYVDDKIKYVCHGHDNMIQYRNFDFHDIFNKEKILNYVEKTYLKIQKYNKVKTYFIANSNHTSNYLESVLPKSIKNNIIKINPGFNYFYFYNQSVRKLPKNRKIRILNIGSFQKKKNQNFILDIAKELLKQTNQFEIHLIGDGKCFQEIKSKIQDDKLTEFIIMHGIQNDVLAWYKYSDLYLHTAYYEPFGLVFLEAMASGLPIVCLNGKGNKDIISHNETGFIFDEQNSKLFANTIFDLINDKELYNHISENGKKVSANFDSGIQTQKMVDFYYSILGK